jgi:hypothetical protein
MFITGATMAVGINVEICYMSNAAPFFCHHLHGRYRDFEGDAASELTNLCFLIGGLPRCSLIMAKATIALSLQIFN